MTDTPKIHASKQPRRPHYIKEWAERRGFRQVDLAAELNTDKSLISRWYAGASPNIIWQQRLAALFGCEPESLFRHPDDDWMARFLRDREPQEIARIKNTLEAAFPRKRA